MGTGRLTAASLKGIWAGVTLSWREDYSLDEDAFRTNLRRLCVHKPHGIYTTGSTGEFYALDWPEFQRVVDIFLEVVGPTGIPTQVGCCADDTRDIIRQIEYAGKAGADGIQVALPYWMELTSKELLQYFRDVSAASGGLPLIHYNIPRTKNYLLAGDYLRILDVAPNLIGVKFTFAGSHFGELQQALRLCPNLSFFVGENLLVTAMQLGARGSCSSIVCANPEFMLKVFDLAEHRRWDEALAMQATLAAFHSDLASYVRELGLGMIDPVVDKGVAVASGFFIGHQRTRPPYIGWSDKGIIKVRAWLEQMYPQLILSR